MKRFILITATLIIVGFTTFANADLLTIGTATYQGNKYKLIYEGELNGQGLVWLDYTKSGNTWQNQVNWASGLGSQLTVILNPGYTTTIDWSTGWRLPVVDESKANLSGPWSTDVGFGNGSGWGGPDSTGYHNYYCGWNMLNSEMGRLFHSSLGNKGIYTKDGIYLYLQGGYGLINTGSFQNLQAYNYWSGTEYSPVPVSAWQFNFSAGAQDRYGKPGNLYALAVHPAEISFSAVPIPPTVWLLGSGLIGLIGLRRKFRNYMKK